MASPPLLNFDELLAPIPGESPAGGSVPFDLREKMEQDRKEEDPADYAADDPMRPEKFKKADWPGIVNTAKSILTKSSKDLLTAARLTEALVKQNGFPGLRDGLHLMRLMVEQAWDRLNPPIESEDDVELRAGPFNWLDDPDHGARFPNSLRNVPFIFGESGKYSWVDWRQSQDGKGTVTREDFEKALMVTPLDKLQDTSADLAQVQEDMSQIVQVLGGKMGGVAPGLTGLKQALDDCRILVQQILKTKAPAEAEGGGGGGAEGGGGGGSPGRVAGSRAEAYRQLAQAAAVLQQLEPHSPIPYLIQKAVELGSLPFPLLIKALIREPNVLAELNREMGIKDEHPPAG